eukprot:scaffold4834_cov90-Phaeocystis_antarctica.AAC.1
MTPNIQPVHRVPAEMLRVAEGELQSQIRSVGASGATGDGACWQASDRRPMMMRCRGGRGRG